ncbi:hypothetical protein ACLB2K_014559 [Fragaria x ananassa]
MQGDYGQFPASGRNPSEYSGQSSNSGDAAVPTESMKDVRWIIGGSLGSSASIAEHCWHLAMSSKEYASDCDSVT